MSYPSKALQEYALKSDLATLVSGGGGGGGQGDPGPPGPTGATGPTGPAGASWTPIQSVSAPLLVSSGSIATAGVTVSRVTTTVDVSGIVLTIGTIPAQQVVILNESGFSITFAPSITSHVSIGNACVIFANTQRGFIWDSVTGYWYPSGVVGAVVPPGTGQFGTGTFGANTFGG